MCRKIWCDGYCRKILGTKRGHTSFLKFAYIKLTHFFFFETQTSQATGQQSLAKKNDRKQPKPTCQQKAATECNNRGSMLLIFLQPTTKIFVKDRDRICKGINQGCLVLGSGNRLFVRSQNLRPWKGRADADYSGQDVTRALGLV